MTTYGDNNNGKRYANRRAVLLPRASTKTQDISVEDQLRGLKEFSEEQGVIVQGIIGAAGISASKSWARTDIDEVINRKRTLNDFDLLIVYDFDRFSRLGPITGSGELRDLWAEGIDVIPTTVEIMDGPLGEMQWIQALTIAQGQVRSASNAITRGLSSAYKDGRCLPCSRIPFGTARFIRDSEGRPRHIVRVSRDGLQVVFNATTGQEIDFYPPKTNGSENRYRKQKNDREELCPGHPDDVELIREMFRRKFIDNWNAADICKDLNERGIPGITGGPWGTASIQNILKNLAYTGVIEANQVSLALYHQCGPNGPIEVKRTAKMRGGKDRPKKSVRPLEDRIRIPQPLMEDFLPVEIRALAREHAEEKNRQRVKNAGSRQKNSDGPRYRNSSYFLTNILQEVTTGLKMSGTGGKNGQMLYRINKAIQCPGIDLPFPLQIDGKPIHLVVTTSLSEMLSNVHDYTEIIRCEVERQRRACSLSNLDVNRLYAERERLVADAKHIHRNRASYGNELAMTLIKENRAQASEIEHKISIAENQDLVWGKDINEKVEALANALADTSGWLTSGPNKTVRRMTELFVAKAAVDTSTKELWLEFRIPKKAYDNPEMGSLMTSSLYKNGRQTSFETSLFWAKRHFVWVQDSDSSGHYVEVRPDDGDDGGLVGTLV